MTAINLEPLLTPVRARPKTARLQLWERAAIGGVALLLAFFVFLPLCSIAYEALRSGWPLAAATFADPYAQSAIVLSAITGVFTIAVNGAFGILAGWTLTKYSFPGKALLLAIIDLPLTISPVVAGLALLLVFGSRWPIGAWFEAHGMQVAFAPPGIILATIFVTFPYVARETIALLSETGRELEEAALGLGATLWQTFARVTFPRARWAILNGVLLCNARALGEFGAVSVISGNIRGLTNTVPLHIDVLYNSYNLVGAFTLAGALALVTITLTFIRSTIDARMHRRANVETSS
jgi:sulfate/thiosulfate transport system permease protein